MNLYIYSDESGVFDKVHNDYFVFGGVICLGTDEKDKWSRIYSHSEKILRDSRHINADTELKAAHLSNKDKGKLFRSLNNCYKFGVVVIQKNVLDRIYKSKKDKQRFLDYVYKIAVKRAFQNLIQCHIIDPDSVERLYFYVDEHTTATNGCYELREGLEQEFKNGTYNQTYDKFYCPIFDKLKDVQLEYCDSRSKLLVRAADIVANRIYYHAVQDDFEKLRHLSNLHVVYLP